MTPGLVGMIHLPGLPGTPQHEGESLDDLIELALSDAACLTEAGFDALLLQNSLDRPTVAKVDAAAVAQMSVIAAAVSGSCSLPLGVNVHKNDGPAAIAIAHAAKATFVRVKVHTGTVISAEGLVTGCAHDTLALRRRLGADIEVWADVHELTSRPLAGDDLESAAVDAATFGAADALIITRPTVEESLAQIRRLRERVPGVALVVGGGVDATTVAQSIGAGDAVIIGRALKGDGSIDGRVDLDMARSMVQAAKETTGRDRGDDE